MPTGIISLFNHPPIAACVGRFCEEGEPRVPGVAGQADDCLRERWSEAACSLTFDCKDSAEAVSSSGVFRMIGMHTKQAVL